MGEVHGSVLSLQGAAILSVLAVLTCFGPQRSLFLFILVAPVASVPAAMGWDYRLYWALMLALKTLLDQGWRWPVTKTVPARALLAWGTMIALTAVVLNLTARRLTSDDTGVALSLLNYFVVSSFLIVVNAHLLRTTEDLKRGLHYAAVATLGVSLYGMWQAASQYTGGASDRIPGPLGNPNYFAAYLTLSAISLIVISRTLELRARRYCITVAVMAMVCALLTLSRMGILATLTGLALLYVTRTGKLEIKAGTFVFGALVLVATVFAVVYVRDMRNNLTFSSDPNLEDIAAVAQEAEDLSRWEAAYYAVQVVADHPLLGVGFGTFTALNYEANGLYVTTHNTILELLVGVGMIGAALFFYFLRCLWQRLNRQGRIFMLPVIGCFVVNSLLGDYLQSLELAVIMSLTYLFAMTISRNEVCAA